MRQTRKAMIMLQGTVLGSAHCRVSVQGQSSREGYPMRVSAAHFSVQDAPAKYRPSAHAL